MGSFFNKLLDVMTEWLFCFLLVRCVLVCSKYLLDYLLLLILRQIAFKRKILASLQVIKRINQIKLWV